MKEPQFKRKDGVPDGFSLIYKAPIETYLTLCKNVTTVTSVVVAGLVVYNCTNLSKLVSIPLSEFSEQKLHGLIFNDTDLVIFLAGFTVMTLAIRILISKLPLRIYRNADKYLAVFDSQLPMKYKHLHFEKGQVAPAKPFLLNPWKSITFNINNHTSVLLIDYFKTPSELFRMLKDETK